MKKYIAVATTIIVSCGCVFTAAALTKDNSDSEYCPITAGIIVTDLPDEPFEIETTAAETTEETTVETEPENITQALPEYYPFSYEEVVALAQMVYGEAGMSPRDQKRLVAIVALNHYDRHCNGGYSLWSIVTDKSQFYGYSSSNPVRDDIWDICIKVIEDYNNGKVDWVDYYYFHSTGDGINNIFS